MLDIYLWGSIALPLMGWGLTVYLFIRVMQGKLKPRYLIASLLCAVLLSTLGSAYRPKNKLPQVNTSSYYHNRADTKIVAEKPRVPTTEQRIEFLDKQREDRLKELIPLMDK